MNIENEVEAPRDDSFGRAAMLAERRRKTLEEGFRGAFRAVLVLALIGAAVSFGYNIRGPEDRPFFIEKPAGALVHAERLQPGKIQCVQDWTEGECYRCAAKNHRGEKVQTHAC